MKIVHRKRTLHQKKLLHFTDNGAKIALVKRNSNRNLVLEVLETVSPSKTTVPGLGYIKRSFTQKNVEMCIRDRYQYAKDTVCLADRSGCNKFGYLFLNHSRATGDLSLIHI